MEKRNTQDRNKKASKVKNLIVFLYQFKNKYKLFIE